MRNKKTKIMIKITFPDQSVKEFAKGTTPLQIAESISPRLAQAVSCSFDKRARMGSFSSYK